MKLNGTAMQGILIPVLGTLLGAISGSIITGSYMVKVQKHELEKARVILSGENGQNGLELYRQKSSEYLLSIIDLVQVLEQGNESNSEVVNTSYQYAEKKAFELMFYSFSLGSKSINLCDSFRDILALDDPRERELTKQKILKLVQEWIIDYATELQKYEAHALPEKWKTDLLGPWIPKLLDL